MDFLYYCKECHLPIQKTVLHALDETWHPEHFCCSVCNLPILVEEQEGRFQIYKGKLYCEDHYANQFLPICTFCEQPIKEKIVYALDKFWHLEHFLCNMCGDALLPFDDTTPFGKVAAFEDMPYCEECFRFLKKPKCQLCKQLITAECITDFGCQWHPTCLEETIEKAKIVANM